MGSKTPEMERFLNDMSEIMFGRSRPASMAEGKCVSCGGDAKEFRDALSRKEFGLSGLCQKCQDEVFAPEDDWDEDDLAGELYDSYDDLDYVPEMNPADEKE